jgi:pimeloyl-ACP methyl ester carboxylesterase
MKKLLLISIPLFFLLFHMHPDASAQVIAEKGIYDCTIGNDKVILIAESASPELVKGYFVLNQGKAVEETHSFLITTNGSKSVIQSDLYSGSFKGVTTPEGFTGKISHFNKKKKLLFFYQKSDVSMFKRGEEPVIASDRYKKEIFSEISFIGDINYGKALGYWTHNPYNNEPYIDVISRSINITMKDPDSLELKMDIYQPTGDTLSRRPLVLLIHGGAFYIGTKQCPTMRILASTLAKRGFVVASIDYRMGFRMRGSDIEKSGYRAVQDAHAALRFLSHYAAKYRIDPDQVFVGGTSAGAIATLNLAFMDNDERPESVQSRKKSEDLGKIEESGNKLTDKFTIKAIVNMWGAVTDINIIDKDENIPVLSIHGTADDIVPYDHDFPFQNALLINRLLMDKMYGSKSITDRLNALQIKNRLISFEGLKHEPQTDKFDKMNGLMDSISNNVTRFYYEQISPEIFVPEKQLIVNGKSAIVPVYTEISKGELKSIEMTGGVKATADPNDLSVIWFKNQNKHELSIIAGNNFGAWNRKTFPIVIR